MALTITLAACAAVWSPPSTIAQSVRADSAITLTGLGFAPCAAALGNEGSDDFMRRLGQWASGYLSGLNAAAAAAEQRNLVGLMPDVIGREIIASCSFADPKTPIATIARRLHAAQPKVSSR